MRYTLKGRSNYTFPINCDPNLLNSLVQDYLSANEYQFITNNGESFYRCGDYMTGYKGFNYSFNGRTLNISVWIIDAFGTDYSLNTNGINHEIFDYKFSLDRLFQEISNLNNGINNVHVFQKETLHRREIMCEVGFWLSIIGFFASFFCIPVISIYLFELFLAIQGLKTRKKGKAIVTMVLSTISSVINIFTLILVLLLNYFGYIK